MRWKAGSGSAARRAIVVFAAIVGAAGATGCAAPAPAPPPKMTLEQAIAQGWELVNVDGERMYCMKTLQTGSHLRHTQTCLTESAWQQDRDATQRAVSDIQNSIKPRMRGDLGRP